MKKLLFSLATIVLTSMAFGQLSWTDQNVNLPNTQNYYIYQIDAVSENTVWATARGASGAAVLYPKIITKTSDGGNTWTAFNLPSNIPAGAILSQVFALDDNTAFLVTAPENSGVSNNGVWKTTDGGSTWTKSVGPSYNSAASFANIIHFWNANEGFTIGDPVNGKYEAYKTTDGGNTWTTLTTAPSTTNPDEFGYNNGYVTFGNSVWLTSSTEFIWHSEDKGITWNKYSTPIMDFGGINVEGSFGHITFSSDSYGLLVGSDGILYYTDNKGQDWDIVETSGFYNGDLKYIPGTANTFISTGGSSTDTSAAGSSVSYDGGVTWNNIDGAVQRLSVGAYSPTAVWAGQFQSTTDGLGGIVKLQGSLANQDIAVTKVDLKAVYQNNELSLVTNKAISTVTVIDSAGRNVTSFKGNKQNVSQLSSGVYIVKVQYKDNSFGTVKFIKK